MVTRPKLFSSRTLSKVFFEGASRLGRLHPRAKLSTHGVELLPNLAYRDGSHERHRFDVYRQVVRTGPAPVVVYLHGGGFNILSKDTHWLMALMFARAGYVVFNVGYRLAPEHPFPAALEDVCSALCFIHQHAAEYGGDASRLVFAGESAGANLATALAITTSFERPEPYARRVFEQRITPRAVIAACGLLQVSDPERFARRRKIPGWVKRVQMDISHAYLGALRAHSPLADPLLILESEAEPARPLPPFFAFAGTRDPILDDTRRLHEALERRRVPHEVHFYPGQPHAFHAFLFLPAARRCWQEQLSFLAAQEGLLNR